VIHRRPEQARRHSDVVAISGATAPSVGEVKDLAG